MTASFGPYGRTEKIPRDLDQITAPWLSRMLANRYPGIVVQSMQTVEVRNGHTTKMRVKLDLNEVGVAAGIPENVCIKANWSEGFDSGDICELEARFYYFVRESLAIPAPQAFYADWDGDGSGQGMVVMEDLALEGGVFGHSTHHIGVDAVAHGLTGLAQLHGAWWNSDKLEQYDWLKESMVTEIDTEQLRNLWQFCQINIDKPDYHKILPKWLLDEPRRLERAYDKLVAYAQSQTGPYCVVHGDSHLGNSYLRPNGERVWLDWQLVRKGRPMRDVTYFMLGTLTIEERRAHETALIRHYLDALNSVVGSTALTEAAAIKDYHHWPMYGGQSWLANQDHWGQHGYHIVERFYQAAEDFDTLKLLEAIR